MDEQLEIYVKRVTKSTKNRKENTRMLKWFLESGMLDKNGIIYDEDGEIVRIKGTEIKEGVLQLKEGSIQKTVPIIHDSGGIIPHIESLKELKKNRRISSKV